MSFIYIMWTNYWARVAALESRYSAAADIGLGGARPGHRPPNSRHSLARIDKEEVRRSGNKTVAPVLAKADRRPREKKKFYHHFSIVKYSYLPKDTFKKLC